MKKLSLLLALLVLAPAAVQAQSSPSWRLAAGAASFKDAPGLWEDGFALQLGSEMGIAKIPVGGPSLELALTADANAAIFPLEDQVIELSGGTLFALSGVLGAKAELDAVVSPFVSAGVGFTSFHVTDLSDGDTTVSFGEIEDELNFSYAGGFRVGQGRVQPFVEYRKFAVTDGADHSTLTLGIFIR